MSTIGIAGADALLHLCPHALLDARDELPRHRAADHLVDELEAGALRQRLHLDVAHGELAVPAGLFDVAAVSLRRPAEGLAQRHAQVDLVDADPEPVGQTVQHDACVRLAHAPQHDLVGLWVLVDAKRRVFGRKPLQADGQFVVVGLGVRLHRDRQQWLGHGPRLEHEWFGLVGQRVSGFGFGQPADRTDVARHHGARRSLLLAQRERQRADPFVLVVILVAAPTVPLFPEEPKKDEKWPDT